MSDYGSLDLENSDVESDFDVSACSSTSVSGTPVSAGFVESGGLEALPLELHRLIMRHLSKPELCSLLLASKALAAIAVHELYRSVAFVGGAHARNKALLAALAAGKKALVRCISIGRFHLESEPLLAIEALLAELCATSQLEAVVYPHSRLKSEASWKSRLGVGVRAIARTRELRYLALGVLDVADCGFLELGMQSKELLGLSAVFSPHATDPLGELPDMAANGDVSWLLPRCGAVDDNVVLRRLLQDAQGTLEGLALDAKRVRDLKALYASGSGTGMENDQGLLRFWEGMEFGRLTRLGLWHWAMGGSKNMAGLLAAVNFEALVELRLMLCPDLAELVQALGAKEIKMKKLKTLAICGSQEVVASLLCNYVPPEQLVDLYIRITDGTHQAWNNKVFVLEQDFINALVGCGSSIEMLDMAVNWASGTYLRGGLVLNGAALGQITSTFTNLRELCVAVDFADWVEIVQHLSHLSHLHTIHLTPNELIPLPRSRAHARLVEMSDLSYEYTLSQVHPSRASAPSLHFDAHARGFLLDLVETILLTCCTRAPLHRAFDFFKDARLRMVGLTMPAGGTGAYQGYWRAVKYAIRAERMAPVWALTQEAKRRSFERSGLIV
ncbi:hypothetical protein BZA05DRAFT_437908 [Tricharina praecox]|uniref:uncharacterized protein n=1 Tax=Tricharina praecox TaxID=43433 RepID=UPI00221F8B93|nr:uncharacterized protein BZA05DRAFT_437908 [Tricharina praecox]KAI5847553.1 hypothetical protein BZA05DRAFT_437908 [Tricharina praecox]